MSIDTVAPAAQAADMDEADALAAFAALATARHDPSDDPAPAEAVTEDDEPTDNTTAAPAAAEVPATVPAAAPAAAATDIWSSATPEVRAAHEAELARERQRYNSDLGRQSAHQARIRFLEGELANRPATPAAAAPAADPEATLSLRERTAIKKVLEEYPEVAGPLLDAFEPVIAENARLGRDLSTLNEDRRAGVIATQETALTAAHPDWRAACGSKDFADWLTAQPAAIKEIVTRNGEHVVNAEEAIAMVGNFKAHYALTHPTPAPKPAVVPTLPAPTDLAARRAAQLEAAKSTPKGGPTAIPDGPAGGSEKAIFDAFAAKKAKKG